MSSPPYYFWHPSAAQSRLVSNGGDTDGPASLCGRSLVDSGTQDNLLEKREAEHLGWTLEPLVTPITWSALDGKIIQLYIKAEKYAFHGTSIHLLGLIIQEGGVKADPEKICPLVEWPVHESTGIADFRAVP